MARGQISVWAVLHTLLLHPCRARGFLIPGAAYSTDQHSGALFTPTRNSPLHFLFQLNGQQPYTLENEDRQTNKQKNPKKIWARFCGMNL